MTIKEIIAKTKEADPDIAGIKVAIQNQSELTFMGNPTEVYFGELADVPKDYFDFNIIETSRICASSDERRNGANVLAVAIPQF